MCILGELIADNCNEIIDEILIESSGFTEKNVLECISGVIGDMPSGRIIRDSGYKIEDFLGTELQQPVVPNIKRREFHCLSTETIFSILEGNQFQSEQVQLDLIIKYLNHQDNIKFSKESLSFGPMGYYSDDIIDKIERVFESYKNSLKVTLCP